MGDGRRGAEGEEEEGCRCEDAYRRSQKRRKLLEEVQSSSSCIPQASSQAVSSPGRTEIKVSSRFDAFSSAHDHLQDAQASVPVSLSDSSHTQAHRHDTKAIIQAHIEGPQSEDSSSTHTQIEHPQDASDSTATHTQIKVVSYSPGTLPPHKSPPLHAHHLPHDLIISNIVASRMSLINLIRARTVCRAWRDAIFSQVIAKSFCANVDCRRPRLVIEHSSSSGPGIAVFDPLTHGWSVIPAPSFGRLVAASSGLFCYVTEAGRPPSLVVGNPLTNQWKHLPAIPLCVPAHGPQIVAMIGNKLAGSYKVMVLFGMWDDDASDAYLPFMYDSVSERWTHRGTISARLSFSTSRSVIKTPDILLSIDSNAGNLLSYDMSNNAGNTTQLKHLPLYINEDDQKTNLWRRLPQVAVCEGALFLVARCLGERTPDYNLGQLPIVQHSSVGIWMMQINSDEWQFVTRIPLDLLEKVVKGSDGTDFIIASNSGSMLFFVLKGSPHMLVYDTALHTWTVLPGCPGDFNSYPLHQSAFYEPLLWIPAE